MADDLAEKQRKMRMISDEDRAEAIAASPNVVGFERFTQKAKQVALRGAYRKPKQP